MTYRINGATKAWGLRIFLRVLSVGFLAAFIPWITLIFLDLPILAPGGALAPLLRFQPYNVHYEAMMAAVYVVWAVVLWRASHVPQKHRLFLDFTIWANAAHGCVMLIATPVQKGLGMTFIDGSHCRRGRAVVVETRGAARFGAHASACRRARRHLTGNAGQEMLL